VGVRETGEEGKHRGTEGTEKRGREEKRRGGKRRRGEEGRICEYKLGDCPCFLRS
jgi:hypothetical protein